MRRARSVCAPQITRDESVNDLITARRHRVRTMARALTGHPISRAIAREIGWDRRAKY